MITIYFENFDSIFYNRKEKGKNYDEIHKYHECNRLTSSIFKNITHHVFYEFKHNPDIEVVLVTVDNGYKTELEFDKSTFDNSIWLKIQREKYFRFTLFREGITPTFDEIFEG